MQVAERVDARFGRAGGVVVQLCQLRGAGAGGHPLRLIRAVVDEALDVLSPEIDRLYARVGRPGIAPEKLLRALLLQAFYSVRSERQLMEQIGYSLLSRWFVGLALDAPVWDAITFSKDRDRLLEGDVAQRLLAAVVAQPRVRALMSDEHFSVDGTLIGVWASHKSFQPRPDRGGDGSPPAKPNPSAGGNAEQSWRGQTRSKETYQSVTDPDAGWARPSATQPRCWCTGSGHGGGGSRWGRTRATTCWALSMPCGGAG